MKILDDLHAMFAQNPVNDYARMRFEASKNNPNQFDHWYPVVVQAGVRSPKTITFPLPQCISDLADIDNPGPFMNNEQVQELSKKIRQIFLDWSVRQLFIKNSLFSGKHHWKYTCRITPDAQIAAHILNLQGLWRHNSPDYATSLVVREMIPCRPAFYAFHDMPITQEYRLFVNREGVYAYQPYWPELSILDPQSSDWKERLAGIAVPEQALLDEMKTMAVAVMSAMPESMHNAWSVDFLIDEKGQPWLIDMAVAECSYVSPDLVKLVE